MEHHDTHEIVTIGAGKDISIVDLTGPVMQVIGYEGEIACDLCRPDGTPHTLVVVTEICKPRCGPEFHWWPGYRTRIDSFRITTFMTVLV
jgi:GDP-L-fucose synthase